MKTFVTTILMIFAIFACRAQAELLHLSSFSSDETPAENLSADTEFNVTGSLLEIEVVNLTDGLDEGIDTGYDITALYFNSKVSSLELELIEPEPGWTLYAFSRKTKAGRFGQFDFALITKNNNFTQLIEGETSKTFTFSMTNYGDEITSADFYTKLSSNVTGDTPTHLAIKFVHGPEDDSAFGGTAPEPATISLLAMGCFFFINTRTKRQKKTICR